MKRTGADLIGRVKDQIARQHLIKPGDRVLAAVSGGPDSVAMLHLLKALAPMMGFKLCAAHLDHGLRGRESAADAAFVKRLGRRWGIPLKAGKADIKAYALKHKISVETAARQLRREFLQKAAAGLKCQRIATGHTANDQAETVLMHLIRGSGLDGLTGIPLKNGRFIRPLLELSREQVVAYLKSNGLAYRSDSSNLSQKYFRNQIRHELLPLLAKYNPSIVQSLCRLAENLVMDRELISCATEQALKACVSRDNSQIAIDLSRFKLYNKGLQSNILRQTAQELSGAGAVPDSLHLRQAIELLNEGRTGKTVFLSDGLQIKKGYAAAVLGKPAGRQGQRSKVNHSDPLRVTNQKLRIPGITSLGDSMIKASLLDRRKVKGLTGRSQDAVYFDAGLLDRGGLEAGPRAEGERMKPFGQRSAKRIKELFIDAKVPRELRSDWPVVRQGGQVLWLCGLRRSALYPVTTGTKKVLCLRYTRK